MADKETKKYILFLIGLDLKLLQITKQKAELFAKGIIKGTTAQGNL